MINVPATPSGPEPVPLRSTLFSLWLSLSLSLSLPLSLSLSLSSMPHHVEQSHRHPDRGEPDCRRSALGCRTWPRRRAGPASIAPSVAGRRPVGSDDAG